MQEDRRALISTGYAAAGRCRRPTSCFTAGLTSGVFQFESSRHEGHPAPVQALQPRAPDRAQRAVPSGPDRRRDDRRFHQAQTRRKKIEYELPELKSVLAETYGVIVYQEQVMQIANIIAGYSLGEADLLRRAMGKKRRRGNGGATRVRRRRRQGNYQTKEDRAALRSDGAVCRIWLQQVALGGLRAARLSDGVSEGPNYPVEFMAALLTSVTGSTDMWSSTSTSAARWYRRRAPDINVSDANFTPHGSAIRFGLAAVKNVGQMRFESIVAGRKDWAATVDL